MSRARRVGGSGWAGVHGSFIGLSKSGGGGKPGVRVGNKSNKKPAPKKIGLSKLPDKEDVQRAAKRVLAVQTDIEIAEKRLATLKGQLGMAMEKLKIAQNLAKPIKQSVRRKRPKPTPSSKVQGA
jgi:hypothetical protein